MVITSTSRSWSGFLSCEFIRHFLFVASRFLKANIDMLDDSQRPPGLSIRQKTVQMRMRY